MSEARLVLPAPIPYRDACLECGHPFSALSAGALEAAVRDHVQHVNDHLSRADDPHFEMHRMERLILDAAPTRQ